MAYKIGVIGDKESILPFQLFGFQVCYADQETEVRQAFQQLVNTCGIIFITETSATLIPAEVTKYHQQVIPAIILIPDYDGARGLGLSMIQDNVEKAVGQNIL